MRLDGGPRRVVGCTVLDRAEHPLDAQTVIEGRLWLPVVGDRADEIDDLVSEAVLVTEAVAGRPPRAYVGVLRLGDQDSPKALLLDRFGAVEEPQHVVFLE